MDTTKKNLRKRARSCRSQIALAAILRSGAGPHRVSHRPSRAANKKEISSQLQ